MLTEWLAGWLFIPLVIVLGIPALVIAAATLQSLAAGERAAAFALVLEGAVFLAVGWALSTYYLTVCHIFAYLLLTVLGGGAALLLWVMTGSGSAHLHRTGAAAVCTAGGAVFAVGLWHMLEFGSAGLPVESADGIPAFGVVCAATVLIAAAAFAVKPESEAQPEKARRSAEG